MADAAVLWGVALVFVAVAAIWDLRTGHIPNQLTFGGLVLGLVLQLAMRGFASAPGGFALCGLAVAFASSLAGVSACGALPYFLFTRNAMGGGDVKLLAAIGAFLGPFWGLQVELYAFVAMAIFVLVRLAHAGRLFQMLGHSLAILVNPVLPKSRRRELDAAALSWHKFGPAVLAGLALVMVLRWRAP